MSQASPGAKRARGEQRPRSVPHKAPFISAVLFTTAFYLCLVGFFAALFVLFFLENLTSALVLVGFLVGAVVLWIFSFFKRREAHCPLCKGTPFLDSAAHKHIYARRYFPLNYGNSNVINSIVFQRYRCPYCGTPFDFLKAPDKQRRRR